MSTGDIPVTRSSLPPFDEYASEIAPLWESHWLTNMGSKHREFERMLKTRLGTREIALFTNGHSALECILETLQLEGSVITTPFTFASTVHAIVRKGLKPVFADVKPDDFTLDPQSVERLIDDDTCAILPVHVYGNLCDVDALQAIADQHHLKLIYDAAHAFGVECRDLLTDTWRNAATFGDASIFSFHATKVFNTIEGGAICTDDSTLKPAFNRWKDFGITGEESVEYIGCNAKMNEFCAAMGICNLRHLDGEIGKRRSIAERYWDLLDGTPGLRLCKPGENVRHNYAYLPVMFTPEFNATRDQVFSALAEQGINARKYFYPLVSDFGCYKERFNSADTPVARTVADSILTLPLYADLSPSDVDRICATVLQAGS